MYTYNMHVMFSIIIIPDCFLHGRELNPDHTSARTHAQTSVGSCPVFNHCATDDIRGADHR